MRQTERQRRGHSAEQLVADRLATGGWQVIGANLRVGRDEVDLLALEPGTPPTVVVVEVRSLRASAFGVPEERVDSGKVRRLYRAAAALRGERRVTPGGVRLADLPWRVDLIVVDGRDGTPRLRHLRALEPP
jgi:putative endonuclease